MATRVKILRDNKTGELFYPVTSWELVFNSNGENVKELFEADDTRFSEIEEDIEDIQNWPAASITNAKKSYWDNKSDFSGSYNDLTNKPTISGSNGQIVTINSAGNWIVSSGQTINNIKGKATITHNTTDHTITTDDSNSVNVYSSADLADVVYGDSIETIPDDITLNLQNVTIIVDKTSDTSTSSFELAPNKMYMFGTRNTLSITLATPSDNTIVNEYTFQFTSGSVATTLNVPSTITWIQDPDIQPNCKYLVSIENSLGIIGEWENE